MSVNWTPSSSIPAPSRQSGGHEHGEPRAAFQLATRIAHEWRASAASTFSATYQRSCSIGLRQPRAHYGVCACPRSAASLHGLIVLSTALRRTPGCTVTVAGPGSPRCRLRRAARGPPVLSVGLRSLCRSESAPASGPGSPHIAGRAAGQGTLVVALRPLCRSAPAFGPLPLGPLSDD